MTFKTELTLKSNISRSVCIGPLGEIVCGSQSDSPSVRRWMLTPNNLFEEVGSQVFHDHWVVAVTSIKPHVNPVFADVSVMNSIVLINRY